MDKADMLVKLYNLDDSRSFLAEQEDKGITIRKPLGGEKQPVIDWVQKHFGDEWVSEAEVAIMSSPKSCFVAIRENQIIGFCCYDATALGFCGPIGVETACRGNGTGKALLLASLLDMKSKGYGYAIIGWVDMEGFEFYRKVAGAVAIPDSFPGVYKGYLQRRSE